MFRPILVPLDGSALDERALGYAAPLGQSMGTPLHRCWTSGVRQTASSRSSTHDVSSQLMGPNAQTYFLPTSEHLRA
jgi:nucleotide-binding universal stress UspA family protein